MSNVKQENIRIAIREVLEKRSRHPWGNEAKVSTIQTEIINYRFKVVLYNFSHINLTWHVNELPMEDTGEMLMTLDLNMIDFDKAVDLIETVINYIIEST